MVPIIFVYVWAWAMGFHLVSPSLSPLDVGVDVRSGSRVPSLNTLDAFRRATANTRSRYSHSVFRNSPSFQKSFVGAVLFEEQVDVSLPD